MSRISACVLFLAIFFSLATSQAWAAKRVALVVGNSAYVNAPVLPNPKNDAEAVAASLKGLGFEVVKAINGNRRQFEDAIRSFAHALRGADAGVFFYAGHGLQVNGTNYLVPVDAKLSDETDLDFEAVPLDTVLKQMERETSTTVVFLDACRDNPLAKKLARSMGTRSLGIGRGLAKIKAGAGTFIAFATQPGNVALDGKGNHSPFTKALLDNIKTPQLDVALLIRRVRREVMAATGNQQVPWNNSSLTRDFYFNPRSITVKPNAPNTSADTGTDIRQGLNAIQKELQELKKTTTPSAPPAPDPAAQAWSLIKDTKSQAILQAFVERFPNSPYADFARARLSELREASVPPSPPPTPQRTPPAPPPVMVPPSFPCYAAKLPAEITICRSPVLAHLDVQMANLYKAYRASSRGARRRQLVLLQRAWLRQRNACGYNASCIEQRYREQIRVLGGAS